MWSNGAPLVFQHFNQYYYGRAIIPYACSYGGVYDRFNDRCVNIASIKTFGQTNLQATTSEHEKCMVMLLSNLAEPEWISIPCHQDFLQFVMCTKKDAFSITHPPFEEDITHVQNCQVHQILADKNCYSFVWHTLKNSLMNVLKKVLGSIVSYFNLQPVLTIFDAIMPSKYIPNIYFKHKNNDFSEVKVSWKDHKLKLEYKQITQKINYGYYLYKFKKQVRRLQMLTFLCKKAGYILHRYVCDGLIDCPNDNSDEVNCFIVKLGTFTQKLSFKNYLSERQKGKCPPLYQLSKDKYCKQIIEGTLLEYKTVNKNIQNERTLKPKAQFKCKNGQIININLLNDLIPDCGPGAEDEPLLKSLLSNKIGFNHCKPLEIPCKDGHIKCYNISDICKFKLNSYYHLTPCRNGANLQNCKLFQCNSMFKCQESYCTLWTYVCDGKWDCPHGDDEHGNPVCGNMINCINMYRCKYNSKICIQLGNICDSEINCPNGDDEMLCQLVNQVCPSACQCLGLAVKCESLDVNNNDIHFSFKIVCVS